MRRPYRGSRVIGLIALATFVLLILPTTASAHVEGGQGNLKMEVGFGTEPAYAGQPNSALILLTHDGQPIVDVGNTLSVEVSFGDESVELPVEANFEVGEFGEPGDYRAWFTPSQPGAYTFRFTGTVDGEEVDQSFTSGPKTFAEVEDPSATLFPAVDEPTTGELSDRIDRESTRVSDQLRAAQATAADAEEAASGARTVGFLGLLVGAIAVAGAIGAFAVGRRKH